MINYGDLVGFVGCHWDAVVAGLTLPYGDGPTEGNVNRLKLVKRAMFGRANFDLLRLRVLHRA